MKIECIRDSEIKVDTIRITTKPRAVATKIIYRIYGYRRLWFSNKHLTWDARKWQNINFSFWMLFFFYQPVGRLITHLCDFRLMRFNLNGDIEFCVCGIWVCVFEIGSSDLFNDSVLQVSALTFFLWVVGILGIWFTLQAPSVRLVFWILVTWFDSWTIST